MSCQRSSSWSWKRHAYQEDFCPVLSLPLPAQNLRTLLSVERLCYIKTIQKLWLNWPDITQKQQKQANAICHRRTFHSQDLIPHQEWPGWKLKYYQRAKSIPKRAAWSDIQRKRLLLFSLTNRHHDVRLNLTISCSPKLNFASCSLYSENYGYYE